MENQENDIKKISNTAERLKEILRERNLTQKELVEMCQPMCEKLKTKIGKSYISRWVSGLYEPNQIRLTILGVTLGVSEVWLMGYDVEKERKELRTNTDKVIDKLLRLDMFDLGKLDHILDQLLEDEKYRDKNDIENSK